MQIRRNQPGIYVKFVVYSTTYKVHLERRITGWLRTTNR